MAARILLTEDDEDIRELGRLHAFPLFRDLVDRHQQNAIFVAIDSLNKSIDRGDQLAREFWAEVIHLIHDYQGDAYAPLWI